jgi:hypothetical protein
MADGRKRRWPSWLEHLLGPARPELGCDECFAQLDRYVELELAGVDAAERMPRLAAHLEGCAVCREEHEDLLAFLRSSKG